MAFIECTKHGGHVASLVSKQVALWLRNHKDIADIHIKKIIFIDDNDSKFNFIVDAESFNAMSKTFDVDLSIPIESEELAFELSLEFEAVCPICLKEWLTDNSD